MRVAIGLKAHSGWAALVAIGEAAGVLQLVDRRRIALVNQSEESWAKQPYHSAESLDQEEAEAMVNLGISSANDVAFQELSSEVGLLLEAGHEIVGCAVISPSPMPDWSTEEILAVHIRMHKAEGVLFPEALENGAHLSGLEVVPTPEKLIDSIAGNAFGATLPDVLKGLARVGKAAGPPWGKDQKLASLAAAIVLHDPRQDANT